MINILDLVGNNGQLVLMDNDIDHSKMLIFHKAYKILSFSINNYM